MTSRSQSKTQGVLDYLRYVLDRERLLALYADDTRGRFVCRAVLQQMSEVAQQICIRLACTGGQFPLSGVLVWVAAKRIDNVLEELHGWAVTTENQAGIPTQGAVVTMTKDFLNGIKASLSCLKSSPWTPLSTGEVVTLETEAGEKHEAVSPEDLERRTQLQWDTVLHFLVGTEGREEPPPGIIEFLLVTKLMRSDPDNVGQTNNAPLIITPKGYDFMLQDQHLQVWHFIQQYFETLEAGEDKETRLQEALLLLICLSFGRVGEPYRGSVLSKDNRAMLRHFAYFGVVYTRKVGKSTIFYPTLVAMQIMYGDKNQSVSTSAVWSLSNKALDEALSKPNPAGSSHLAVIVQTNFQVCAYTTSELHVSMLGLFCDVRSIRRLPNMVFLQITRDSIKAAFSFGIQAHQILRFLEKHAHPRLRQADGISNIGGSIKSPIPANVVDQIWLWDREQTRVQMRKVRRYDCPLDGEFDEVLAFVKPRGACAWSSLSSKTVFVDWEFAEQLDSHLRDWKIRRVKGA